MVRSTEITLDAKRRKEAEAVAREAFDLCVKAMRRRAQAPMRVRKGWSPKLKITWRKGARVSRGSSSQVKLALTEYIAEDGSRVVLREYARIADDPTIGDLLAYDWRLIVKALVAHEVAHSAQFSPETGKTQQWRAVYGKPHSLGWRRIYAYLRSELGVNEEAKAQGGAVGRTASTRFLEHEQDLVA